MKATVMANNLTDCPDCGVKPGQPHDAGCDVERCSVCGEQYFCCDDHRDEHDKMFARWTGIWPGLAEAKYLGIDLNQFHQQGLYKVFFVKPAKED